EAQLLAACDDVLRLAPAEYPPHLAPSEELFGAEDWYDFEREAWAVGEQVRQAFVRNPKFKKNISILKKVLEVATCRNLRRGRQSFIMVLGFVAAGGFAEELAPALKDSDVNGHVLSTLLKMKATGFAAEVAPLASDERTWIRKLAKNYVER